MSSTTVIEFNVTAVYALRYWSRIITWTTKALLHVTLESASYRSVGAKSGAMWCDALWCLFTVPTSTSVLPAAIINSPGENRVVLQTSIRGMKVLASCKGAKFETIYLCEWSSVLLASLLWVPIVFTCLSQRMFLRNDPLKHVFLLAGFENGCSILLIP